MSYPWEGRARGMPASAFDDAARELGCEPAAIRAIWQVEAAGRGFLADGSLLRRFEPHKMPGARTSWRDSLKLGKAERDAALREAYARNPAAAIEATSWGGPQILGSNARDAGFRTALAMVEAMADREVAHVEAFVRLVEAWGLATVLRAHDWDRFEKRYNGGGFGGAYARKIEKAYRAESGGKASPVVLRLGDSGAAVRRLQAALDVKPDGSFGPETDAALRKFQRDAGLVVDGIAGRKTWAALEQMRDAAPPARSISWLVILLRRVLEALL